MLSIWTLARIPQNHRADDFSARTRTGEGGAIHGWRWILAIVHSDKLSQR